MMTRTWLIVILQTQGAQAIGSFNHWLPLCGFDRWVFSGGGWRSFTGTGNIGFARDACHGIE